LCYEDLVELVRLPLLPKLSYTYFDVDSLDAKLEFSSKEAEILLVDFNNKDKLPGASLNWADYYFGGELYVWLEILFFGL